MVNVNEEEMITGKRDVFPRATVGEHCFKVIVQFLVRVLPWSSERLDAMPDFSSRMNESGRVVFLPLPPEVMEGVRYVDVHRTVTRTSYGLARAFATVVCACKINWTCPDVVGWYLYDFTTETLYKVLLRGS